MIEEIKIPHGLFNGEKIVGVTNFRGDVIIATEYRLYRMSHDELTEVKFELEKDANFYKCCALSGEVPEEGSEPSAVEEHGTG